MSGRVDEVIEVMRVAGGGVSFRWRGRVYTVAQVIGRSREAADWWQGGREIRRYRVWASDGDSEGVFELSTVIPSHEWRLVRVVD